MHAQTNEQANACMHKRMNERTSECTNTQMNKRMHERMNARTRVCTSERMNTRTHELITNELMIERTNDERMDEHMHARINK